MTIDTLIVNSYNNRCAYTVGERGVNTIIRYINVYGGISYDVLYDDDDTVDSFEGAFQFEVIRKKDSKDEK